METLMAWLVGFLFAAGVFALLRRNLVRLVIGVILLGHAANLLIFSAGGLTRAVAPILPAEGVAAQAASAYADPLPQALVLTAIVIGFGLTAFLLVLVRRAYEEIGQDDVDQFDRTDR